MHLPLLESVSEPRFEPLALDALLTPPCALVVIAGVSEARGPVAAAFVRALSELGLRANLLAAARAEELVGAVDALAPESDVIVANGNAPLGIYRPTLSIVVGPKAAVSADSAGRALLARADVEVEDASPALVAALAALVARAALRATP